jgi:hypothetical protein
MSVQHIEANQTLTVIGPARIILTGGEVVDAKDIPAPTVTSLSPASAEIGSADFNLLVNGSGFNEFSKIVFNGYDEPTTLMSPTQLRTGVKPSLFAVPVDLPVAVRTGEMVSAPQTFSFTAPAGRKR